MKIYCKNTNTNTKHKTQNQWKYMKKNLWKSTAKTQTQTQNTKQNLWKSMKTYKTWYTNTKHKRHTSSFLETVIQFCKANNCLFLSSRGAGALYWLYCTTIFTFSPYFFPLTQLFLIEKMLRTKNLYSKSSSERPINYLNTLLVFN